MKENFPEETLLAEGKGWRGKRRKIMLIIITTNKD